MTNNSDSYIALRRLREYVAAGIALIIIMGTVVLILYALVYTANPEQFSLVKELLQIIIPLLTFVLGYYFNKTRRLSENSLITPEKNLEVF